LNNIKMEWIEEEKIWDVLYDLLLETNWEKEVKIIPTWYAELDKLVWWYEDWQIIVVGARPWVWKSMFAINLISNNISAWENVALFSLEMNNKQILRRLLALNSWVWVWKLKKKVEWDALSKVQQWFEKLSSQLERFHCIDNIHTISEVERKIRQLTHKEWVKIFYLDYLQLIRNPAVKNNPVEALTDISQKLKQLALELNVVIVELSQLNRDADKSAIKRASQLRWSWSIEQDADMVWMLDKQDEDSNRIQLSVQKCRDWRIWEIELLQASDIMLIKDLPPKPF
jgi:replicative DNA helicase